MDDFHGVWRTDILPFPDGNGAFQGELRLADGTAENIHHEYASASGDRPRSTSRRVSSFTWRRGESSGQFVLELLSRRSFFTIHDPERAATFSAKAVGGFTDWQAGVPKDVTGIELGGHRYDPEGIPSTQTLTLTSDSLETDAYPGLPYHP